MFCFRSETEAIFEDFQAKADLFKTLNEILDPKCIVASNTSSFAIKDLAMHVLFPQRFIGMHYFYHAAMNRLVEIIPGRVTSLETIKTALRFATASGKDPIFTRDEHGFAVNRFFVPWLNEAAKLLAEPGMSTKLIDEVCMKTFGIGMGPFALMNATGVPVAMYAERSMEFFGPSYKVSALLEEQVNKKLDWTFSNGHIPASEEQEKSVRERMLGCVFFVCSQILEEQVCSAIDLNKGARIGLRWKQGPLELMKKTGIEEVKRLIQQYAARYNEQMPRVTESDWQLEYVSMDKKGPVAVITVNRPEELNALNADVIRMLDYHFTEAERDPAISNIYITGSGKAFVAGADIS